jgi:stage II sporulation protein D
VIDVGQEERLRKEYCVVDFPRYQRKPSLWLAGTLLLSVVLILLWPRAPRSVPEPVSAAAAFASEPGPLPQVLPPDGRMRIGLRRVSGKAVVQVQLSSAGTLLDGADGKTLAPLPPDRPLKLVADYSAGKVRVETPRGPVSRPEIVLTGGLVRIGKGRYPGRIRVSLAGTGLQLVNDLDIEEYLEGVLPGEIPASFGAEAQKAQAVAARTYALVQRGKHGEFDLCDRTCCQMYLGHHRASRPGLDAVRATRRQCLWSADELAYTFYSADCGGISTRVEHVPLRDKPDQPLPYLTVVRDSPGDGAYYCRSSPYHQWTKRLSRDDIERRLNRDPETQVGRLKDLEVLEFDESGRVHQMRLRGEHQGQPVVRVTTGWAFRSAVGPITLKSTLFEIDEPVPGTYRFQGRGFGHGLGLCQIGANGMARHGKTYRQILAHYYPGTQIASVAP